jgi:hypothetical protein
VIPAARKQTGFVSTYFATGEEGKALALTCFDTHENLKKSEDTGYYKEQVAKFKPHQAGEPSKKIFDVVVHEVKVPVAAR